MIKGVKDPDPQFQISQKNSQTLKGQQYKTITKKCFDSKLVSNRLFHVSNRLIRAKSAQKRKKNLYLPQKKCVSKAKLGRICVILSPCQSRRPQGKLLQRECIHTRKHSPPTLEQRFSSHYLGLFQQLKK